MTAPKLSYCSLPPLALPSVLVRPLCSTDRGGGDLRGSVVVKENCRIIGDIGGGGDGGRRRS